MAGLTRPEEAVHEVEVADQRGVDHRGSIRRCPTSADHRGQRVAAKAIDLAEKGSNRRAVQRAECATERIEDRPLQPIDGLAGNVVERSVAGERGELLGLRWSLEDREL